MVVEHIVLDANTPRGFLCFGTAAHGKLTSALGLMSCVAVGQRDELYLVAQRGEFCSQASCLEVAVVGMRAKSDHTHGVVLCVRRQRREHQQGQGAENLVSGHSYPLKNPVSLPQDLTRLQPFRWAPTLMTVSS